MKKSRWILPEILLVLLLLGIFSGCGKEKDADTTTVFADKTGRLEQLIVEPLGGEDYTAEELEAYVSEQIAAYKEQTGSETIHLDFCKIQEDTIKIKIRYESWNDYQEFNQVICFEGSLEEAQEAGYAFEGGFLDNTGKQAAGATILAYGQDWNVLILEEPVAVEVPGAILYVSDNVTVTGDKTASITGSETQNSLAALTEAPAYVIFK